MTSLANEFVPLRQVARRGLHRIRPRRMRLREREFWITQALVAIATIVIYGFDLVFHHDGIAGGLHDIPVIIVIAPVIYAALAFGLEGAILTSLWCALLMVPHSVVVAGNDFEWLGDVGTISVITVAGSFLAFRVDRERAERRRAEATSDRLRLLNELSSALDRPIESDQLLQRFIDRLRENLDLDFIWARYHPLGNDNQPVRVTSGDPALLRSDLRGLITGAATEPSGDDVPADVVVIPLAVEGRPMGMIGASRGTTPLDDDERGTLTAAAAQASISLENHALQLSRREILTSYARQVTNAQEEERRRIARDLHDGPTQALTGLCRGLDLVQAGLADNKDLSDTTRSLRVVAEEAVADLRRLARDLRPRILDDLGLRSAIEWLSESLRDRSDLDVRFHTTGDLRQLTGEQELAAFRIVQEALTNVEKHANASTVEIRLDSDLGKLRIEVRDDGIGLVQTQNEQLLSRGGRYGILGMRERARLNDGELRIDSTIGAGTTVTLEFPYAEPARETRDESSRSAR